MVYKDMYTETDSARIIFLTVSHLIYGNYINVRLIDMWKCVAVSMEIL